MDEVLDYLKTAQTYYLATVDALGNPQVRPFGTICKIDGALYIQTGMSKDCYKQMVAHPHVAISACNEGTWIRLEADAVPSDDVALCEAMLNDYPELRAMYTPGDGNTVVMRLDNVTATFCSFTDAPHTVEF